MSEEEIIERFGSLSSSAIGRIMQAGFKMIRERAEDGVFE